MTHLPLKNVTIIDLTRLLPGPVATQHLADMGATVIKIEDTGVGDYARKFGLTAEQLAQGQQSPFFTVINRGKQVEKLDLKTTQGHARLMELVATADALIESFRPGVMDKLGLGYPTLSAINPRLVYCAISGYGQTGPLRDTAGHDINYLATAGAFPALMTEEGTPALPNLQIADLMGGALMAAMSTLAAIIGARATGHGRFVDVSMTDGVMLHNLTQLYAHNLSGKSKPAGQDMLNGGLPCYGLYRCADNQYLAIGALELKFWERVCTVLQRPQWIAAHQQHGIEPGSEKARQIKHELAALIATQPLAHWVQQFNGVDACVSAVLSFEDALSHPQFTSRGIVAREKNANAESLATRHFSLKNSLGLTVKTDNSD